ncbi:hypothetical protein Tco_0283041 [Tanacetum coccineum]
MSCCVPTTILEDGEQVKKFPNIPKRIEEDYHSIKDDIPLIRETDDFKEYEMVFMKVAVPMNQLRGGRLLENQAHTKSLKITIKKRQIVEKDDDDTEDRIEPRSHKDNLKFIDDDDDKAEEKNSDDMGSLEIWVRFAGCAEFQDVDKRVPTIFDRARMEATLRDSLSNQSRNAKEFALPLEQSTKLHGKSDSLGKAVNSIPQEMKYILSLHKIHTEEFPEPDLEEKLNQWVQKVFKIFNEDARITEVVRIVTYQPHGLDFMEQILVMRANDKPNSFSEADFKYLNQNDIEDLYYLCQSKEIDNQKIKLMSSLITFIRSCVIINAQEMIYKELATHGPKMIEELFQKHMQNITLNIYLTTSSSTAEKSTAYLQQQLYLEMKTKSQDQAADPELWEILMAKFENS